MHIYIVTSNAQQRNSQQKIAKRKASLTNLRTQKGYKNTQ